MSTSNGPGPAACQRAWDWIEQELDGKLHELHRAPLAAHVSACAACASLQREAREVRAVLRAAPRAACPDSVVQGVLAAVDARAALSPRTHAPMALAEALPPRPLRRAQAGRRVRWARVAVPLAAAVVLLLVVPALLRRPHDAPVAQRPSPSTPTVGASALARGAPAASGARTQSPVDPQVEAATAQLRMALSIVAHTMDHTSVLVEQNVRSSIASPFLQAFDRGSRSRAGSPAGAKQTGALDSAGQEEGKA